MPASFLIIVLTTAIIAFFSEEITDVLKKFFKIPGVKLLLPLGFASWLVLAYQSWIVWILLFFNFFWQYITLKMAEILPLQISYIIILTIIPLIPTWIRFAYLYNKKLPINLNDYYFVAIIIWICMICTYAVSTSWQL